MAAVFVRYHVRPPSATGDATRVSNVMKSMIILMVFFLQANFPRLIDPLEMF